MRRPSPAWRRDVILAVVVTVVAQVELVLLTSEESVPTSWALSNLLLLPSLTLRRVRPLAATIVAAFGFALPVSPAELAVATPFLALLVVLASLGWYASLRHGLLGSGVVLAAGLGRQLLTGTASPADAIVNVVILVATWATAFLLHRAAQRRVEAEVRADRAAREAVVLERARIARDLHDSMGHALTLITLQAGASRERAGDESVRELLGGIEHTARSALADLNRLLHLGGREGDEALGIPALSDLVAEVGRHDLRVDLQVDLDEVVPATLSTAVYRVVQEGLTNVVRHSASTHARVAVSHDDGGGVVVRIQDDGPARPAKVAGSGVGLVGLDERVGLLGGTLCSGAVGGGWRLEARIPWTG